jgi:hypothetical protein
LECDQLPGEIVYSPGGMLHVVTIGLILIVAAGSFCTTVSVLDSVLVRCEEVLIDIRKTHKVVATEDSLTLSEQMMFESDLAGAVPVTLLARLGFIGPGSIGVPALAHVHVDTLRGGQRKPRRCS